MRNTLTTPQSTSKASGLSKLRIDRGERPERAKWDQRFVVITITAVAVLGMVLLAAHILTGSVPEVQTVRVTSVASAGSGIVLSATGYIVAHHKIDVNSKVTGRVKWIGVEKGDLVKAGQVLVELEDDEFKAQLEQARGQVEAARASLHLLQTGSRPEEIEEALNNLEQARATVRDDKITLDRTRQLAEEGVVARQQLDDAQARYEADERKAASLSQAYALTKLGPREEEIQRARGNLDQADGQLAYAEAQFAATRIRAPLTGTILERTAEKGELVTSTFASAAAGGPLGSVVSLADLKDLQVELDIAQDDFAKLHPHEHGIVTTDAYPDRKFQGVLTEVSPEANRQKATVQVKVRIENPDDYLRPDMNATVQFLSDATTNAETATGVLVPTNSLHTEGGRQYVLIALNDRAVVREVRVVSRRPDGAVVNGLRGGEDVIIGTTAVVKNGSRIKRKQYESSNS
jgi:HlyD family secretion protein